MIVYHKYCLEGKTKIEIWRMKYQEYSSVYSNHWLNPEKSNNIFIISQLLKSIVIRWTKEHRIQLDTEKWWFLHALV